MRTAGIICEYNPFHNGHAYLIQQAREHSDRVICLMSGNYVQRGEPSLTDKWHRAEMALHGGASLVLELPTICATASAERYASSAIRLLTASGTVTHLVFGAECKDLSLLQSAADFLAEEPRSYKQDFKQALDSGLGFAAARSLVLSQYLHCDESVLKSPNNILAIEYLKAIRLQHAPLIPVLIPHKGNDPDTNRASRGYTSASQIRRKIGSGEDYEEDVPLETFQLLKQAPLSAPFDDWSASLYETLLRHSTHSLTTIRDISEGLENRILNTIDHPMLISEAIGRLVTRRYPRARIRRILLNILLDIRQYEPEPDFLRVLGFRVDQTDALTALTESSRLPVLTNPPRSKELLKRESYYTDLYMAHLQTTADIRRGEEFRHPIVKI